jgi:hypothetical protein
MSLKTFHLVFIALSVVMAAFVAAWAVGQYRLEQEGTYVAAAAVGVVAAATLALYGTRFQRKARRL